MWRLILALALSATPALAGDAYVIRPQYPVVRGLRNNPLAAGSDLNPWIIQPYGSWGGQAYEVRPAYPHIQGSGLSGPGSDINPWVIRPLD